MRKKLKVDRIEVSGVEVTVRKTAPKEQPKPAAADSVPATIELPIAIDLGELSIKDARLTVPDSIAVDLRALRAGGSLDAYWLEADAMVSAAKLKDVAVSLAARGAADHADVRSLRVKALDGTLTVDGQAAWSPAISWDMAAAIDRMAPGKLLADPKAWPGTVSLRVRSGGKLVEGQPHAKVLLDSLAGTLRGHPLGGRADLALAGRRLDIEAIDLSWGAAGLRLKGRVEETIDLTFAVETSDLGVALPGASGAVHVAGKAAGSRSAPKLDIELTGDAIAVANHRVEAVSGRIVADLSESGRSDVSILARGIASSGVNVDSLALTALGTRRTHEATTLLRSDSLGLRLDLAAAGGLVDSTWKGHLNRLDIVARDAGEWGLEGPAEVRAGKSAAGIDGFCLKPRGGPPGGAAVDPATHVCIDGSWARAKGADGKIDIAALPLALFRPFLPNEMSIDGTMAVKAQAAVDPDTRIKGDVELAIEGGALTMALADTTDTIGFATEVQATAGAGGVRAELKGDLKRADIAFGDLAGQVALPRLTHLSSLSDTLAPQPLSGKVALNFSDLGPLALLSSKVDSLAGRIAVTVDAGGELRKPDVKGQVVLSECRVNLPEAGLELRDIELTARGDTSRKLDLEGSLRSGAGDLRVTAKSTFAAAESLRAEVRIEGQRFTVMNTPEAEVMISPDLEAHAVGRQVDVKGEVAIPLARIELTEIPRGAQGPSADVRFVDAEAQAAEPPLDVSAEVRVVLGDSVSFKGHGFYSHFSGAIKVIEDPGQPTSGTGEIRIVNGRYLAYGQDLTVGTWGDTLTGEQDPGRIIFSGGPIENPGLNMRAFREADDGTIAGLHIEGTAKEPEIVLFSEPSMPDADCLSYILLGHEAGEGGENSSLLADAAIGMGLKGGNTMARSMGSKVGLDETGIETEGGIDEATLVTGKYLSPKLYVGYGYGLFDQVSTFRTRYLVSRQVTVQAETGAGSGGDVLYRLERGR